jgi:F0F1-type ATP synthase membrane subunit b/b'
MAATTRKKPPTGEGLTFEKVWAMFQETDRKMKEMNEQQAKRQAEWEAQQAKEQAERETQRAKERAGSGARFGAA